MYTQNSLPTDSTAGPFPIGFNYLDAATIIVTRFDADGVSNPVPLTFTFAGSVSDDQPKGSSIVLSAAQPSGKVLVIKKVIDLDTPALIWNQGAEITQKNLRKTTRNLMEMAQTAVDLATANSITLDGVQGLLSAIETLVPETILEVGAEVQANRDEVIAALSDVQDFVAGLDTTLATRLGQVIELDFGSGEGQRSAVFTVTTSGISVNTPVRVTQIANAATGRSQDESELDTIVCTAVLASANTLTIYANSLFGPVSGKYKFVITY